MSPAVIALPEGVPSSVRWRPDPVRCPAAAGSADRPGRARSSRRKPASKRPALSRRSKAKPARRPTSPPSTAIARLDREGQSETRRARRAPRRRRSAPHRRRPRRARLPQRQPGLSRSLHRSRAPRSAEPAGRPRPAVRARHRRPSTPPSGCVIDGPGATVEFQDDGEYRVAIGGTDAVEVELVVLRGQAALVERGRQRPRPAGPPRRRPRRRRAVDAGVEQRRPDHAREVGRRSRGAVAERPVRVAAIPARRARRLRRHLRSLRHLAERRHLRRRLVSDAHRRGLAALLRRPLGLHRRTTAGHGSRAATSGPTPPITTAAGTSARAAGTGFPRGAGARPGSTGRSRPTTSAGARSAGTAGPVLERVPLRPQLHRRAGAIRTAPGR